MLSISITNSLLVDSNSSSFSTPKLPPLLLLPSTSLLRLLLLVATPTATLFQCLVRLLPSLLQHRLSRWPRTSSSRKRHSPSQPSQSNRCLVPHTAKLSATKELVSP